MLVCEKCRNTVYAFTGKCLRCNSDFEYREGLPYCNTCKSARHPFDGVVSSYFYSHGVNRAIIEHKFNFNFNNSKTLAIELSRLLQNVLKDNMLPIHIVPIPSDRKRIWARGYDPLLEIAEEISATSGFPLLTDVLVKHKNIPQQSTISSVRQRMRNVRGCFSVKNKEHLKDKAVVLLDDVYTTGATTRECAKILRRNGCKYILIATVAISETFRR